MDSSARPHDEPSTQSTWLPRLAWGAIVVAACAVFFGNLRFGKDVLSIGFEDDFFYYAQVARNLAFHGTSTFDGTHLTNGYHPLWLLVVTAVTKLFDIGGVLGATSVYPMALALETIQFALILAIAWFVLRIARLFLGVAESYAVQLLAVTGAMIIVRSGMEAGLTMALAFALLWFRLRPEFHWSKGSGFVYGMLASCMVLSRLDSALFLALLFLLDVVPSGDSMKPRLRNCAMFLLGLWPLAVYAAVNLLVFDSLLPISGTAKELRDTHYPSPDAMLSFASRLFLWKLPVYSLCVVLVVAAPVLLLMKRRRSPDGFVGIFWAAMMFPLVHFLTVVTLSDWMIWQWYMYAWPIAGVMAAIVLLRPPKLEEGHERVALRWFGFALALLAMDVGYLVHASRLEDELTYLAGEDIAAFAAMHPGIYAMGDRAGAPAYLAKVPMVQLEGLMMDPDFLDNIRAQKNVKDVLFAYHVRYYISTDATVDASGCYVVREPMMAGPDSAAMRALICQKPVATFKHRDFVNHIFDMQ